MERPYWTNEEILDELVGLNFTEVLDFGIDTLLHGAGTRLLCLAHGNIDDDTVIDLYLLISQTFALRSSLGILQLISATLQSI